MTMILKDHLFIFARDVNIDQNGLQLNGILILKGWAPSFTLW